MSKRRRTPNLVETITGNEPGESPEHGEESKRASTSERSAHTQQESAGTDRVYGSNGERERRTSDNSASSRSGVSASEVPHWSAEPKRSNVTFRLSEEVSDELERLILTLRLDHGVRTSRSEITEVALQLAVEDAERRGEFSDVVKRLSGKLRRRHDGDKDASK